MAERQGFDLAAMLQSVSKLDTSAGTDREQIEYIDIDRIDGDPNNFYALSDLDQLAENIELLGLQQPLRVRSNPDTPDRVIVVSGHRRQAALRKLIEAGRTDLREVPCIRERAEGSAALAELRLIYANSDTRKLSSAEISRQAERVELLLYQLKEEGYDFPGRMRDHVAEACKVSKSKLARLKVIREKLIPELARAYRADKLKESAAYTLAQRPPEVQRLILKYLGGKREIQYWSEWSINDAAINIEKVRAYICKKTGKACSNQQGKLEKLFNDPYSHFPCASRCCAKCSELKSCRSACPRLSEQVKKLRSDAREAKRQERLAKEAAEAPDIQAIQMLWIRFGHARELAGKSIKQTFKALDRYYSADSEKEWIEQENADAKTTPSSPLPYGYGFSLREAQRLCAAADLFGCTVDFLLCRTETPQPSAAPQWYSGQKPPAPDQLAAAKFLPDGAKKPLMTIARWNGGNWTFLNGTAVGAPCVGWFPLLEEV